MSQPILSHLSSLLALVIVLAGFLGAPPSKAAETASLSCRVHGHQIKGAFRAPVVSEFVWSAAHGTEEDTGPIKTSIGQIYQGADAGPSTVLTLDGKALRLPASLAGLRPARSMAKRDEWFARLKAWIGLATLM